MTTKHVVACATLLFVIGADLTAQRRGRRFRRPGGPPATAPRQETKEEVAKKVESWTAIQGADVYLGTGSVLRRATVLIGDDKIRAVGHDVEIPDGAKIIDATGKTVSPGFCMVKANGLGGPGGGGRGGRGGRGGGGGDGDDLKDSVNPFDPEMKLGLAAGITSFLVLLEPGSNTPAGRSAIVKLAYGDLDGMIAIENPVAAMRVPLDPRQMREFKGLVRQARRHLEAVAATPAQGQAPRPPRGTEAILEIMQGKKRLWISAGGGGGSRGRGGRGGRGGGGGGYDGPEIRQALEIADLLGVGVVLDNPVTAWVNPDEIAATGSMAILSPRTRVAADPGRPDETGSNLASAAILDEAGVPVAVTTGGGRFGSTPGVGTGGILGQDLNTPTVDAAYAVRGGLDDRKGIRTITLDAAKIMGAETRIGSIEVGKDADLLILDGDPMHYKTFVQVAFVNGKVVYEKDKEPFYRHIQR